MLDGYPAFPPGRGERSLPLRVDLRDEDARPVREARRTSRNDRGSWESTGISGSSDERSLSLCLSLSLSLSLCAVQWILTSPRTRIARQFAFKPASKTARASNCRRLEARENCERYLVIAQHRYKVTGISRATLLGYFAMRLGEAAK
jgi:hypothetical protein